ncbi:MAG: thiolase family protein [Desulfitobacteriaceae bacterium]
MRDEVVVVSMVRTPTGLFGSNFKDLLGIDMATMVIKEAVSRAGLDQHKELIDDVIFGQMYFRNKDECNVGRLAAWRAGLPETVPGLTVQRACASGLQAIISGVETILAGNADIVVAGGTESMSNAPYELYSMRWGKKMLSEELFDSMYPPILSCPPTGTGMGITAENLAEKMNISREEMDEFAFTSHQLAIQAIDAGRFKEEIMPVTLKGKKNDLIISEDEGPRRDISLEKMSNLKPAFKAGGKVTAANATTLNDGASTLVLMSGKKAKELGLKPIARYVSCAVVGLDPDIMGYGPVPATKKALTRAGLKIEDIDLFEVNEAFAVVPLAFMKEFKVKRDKMNVNGGAIAIGHAIGSSGARISVTLLSEMRRRKSKYGITAICQGTGMGTSVIWEMLS